jgi:hypothetical protein
MMGMAPAWELAERMYFIMVLHPNCLLQVYDATPFLNDHPGGAEAILDLAGQDATEDFNAIHSKKVSHALTTTYI